MRILYRALCAVMGHAWRAVGRTEAREYMGGAWLRLTFRNEVCQCCGGARMVLLDDPFAPREPSKRDVLATYRSRLG